MTVFSFGGEGRVCETAVFFLQNFSMSYGIWDGWFKGKGKEKGKGAVTVSVCVCVMRDFSSKKEMEWEWK